MRTITPTDPAAARDRFRAAVERRRALHAYRRPFALA